MPYGMPMDMGGDSPENTKWMEDCISAVKNKNPKMGKEQCIAICKSTFMKNKGDKAKAQLQVELLLDLILKNE